MDIYTFVNSFSPSQEDFLTPFLLAHPKAYLQEAQGLRSGIVRYHEWRVVDPDLDYLVIGVGKDPQAAFYAAYNRWDDLRRKEARTEGF